MIRAVKPPRIISLLLIELPRLSRVRPRRRMSRRKRQPEQFDVGEFLRESDADLKSALNSLLRSPQPEPPQQDSAGPPVNVGPGPNLVCGPRSDPGPILGTPTELDATPILIPPPILGPASLLESGPILSPAPEVTERRRQGK